jgi:SAM-dependent methyltransferase
VIDKAGLRRGDNVVDVACGAGAVTVEIAKRVGPTGHVVATDLSPKMVAAVEVAAISTGLANVEGACCDAEHLTVDGPFDVGLCSLGLMYTPDPAAAIGELSRVIGPGGRLAIAVWGERRRCGWASVFGIVDARVTSDVCPRFFALGAPGALAELVRRTGFVDVDEVRLTVDLEYRTADEAIGAAFLGGPVALAYARFDAATRAQVHSEYLTSIAEHAGGDGTYRVPGEFVIVAARRSGRARPDTHQRSSAEDLQRAAQPS